MTLVIAHRDGWVVSDLRAMEADRTVFPGKVQKATRLSNTIIGSAGAWSFHQRMAPVLTDIRNNESEAISMLSSYLMARFDEGNDINMDFLVVNRKRELTYMDSTGAYLAVEGDFHCIGSGSVAGWAYLTAVQRTGNGKILPMHAEQAIHYISTLEPTVGYETSQKTLF